MPLVVVVAAVIAFFVIVSLLLLADLAERRHMQQLRLGVPSQAFSPLSITQAFDPDRSILWDTQLPALRQLASAALRGCSLPQLYSCYLIAARKYPELYDGSSFEQWLAFLASAELVRVETDRAYITGDGRQFVQEFMKCRLIGQGRTPASR